MVLSSENPKKAKYHVADILYAFILWLTLTFFDFIYIIAYFAGLPSGGTIHFLRFYTKYSPDTKKPLPTLGEVLLSHYCALYLFGSIHTRCA